MSLKLDSQGILQETNPQFGNSREADFLFRLDCKEEKVSPVHEFRFDYLQTTLEQLLDDKPLLSQNKNEIQPLSSSEVTDLCKSMVNGIDKKTPCIVTMLVMVTSVYKKGIEEKFGSKTLELDTWRIIFPSEATKASSKETLIVVLKHDFPC